MTSLNRPQCNIISSASSDVACSKASVARWCTFCRRRARARATQRSSLLPVSAKITSCIIRGKLMKRLRTCRGGMNAHRVHPGRHRRGRTEAVLSLVFFLSILRTDSAVKPCNKAEIWHFAIQCYLQRKTRLHCTADRCCTKLAASCFARPCKETRSTAVLTAAVLM